MRVSRSRWPVSIRGGRRERRRAPKSSNFTRAGDPLDWIKIKNPDAPAATRSIEQ
jgi:hypothetical protein